MLTFFTERSPQLGQRAACFRLIRSEDLAVQIEGPGEVRRGGGEIACQMVSHREFLAAEGQSSRIGLSERLFQVKRFPQQFPSLWVVSPVFLNARQPFQALSVLGPSLPLRFCQQ